jgi:arylsulfatase
VANAHDVRNVDDPATDPKFGRVGKQKIQDTALSLKKALEEVQAKMEKAAAGHSR